MKLFVVAAVLGVCLADRLDNKYLPPRGNAGAGVGAPGFGGFGAASKGAGGFGAAGSFGSGSIGGFGGATQYSGNAYNAPASAYNAPNPYNAGAYNAPQQYNSRPQDANAQTLRQNQEVGTDTFSFDFETSNGIRADAHGVATNGVQEQGSFAYKGDDGQDYSITYTADENGYRPQGAHLPTPPPIPEEILKSLEQNARDEAAGIVDDGSYRGEGAGAGGYSAGQPGGYSGGHSAGGHSAGGYSAGGYSAPSGPANAGAYSAPRPSSGFNSGFGGRAPNNFGASPSRQYLTPKAGARGSGNGNFNPQSGYQY